MARVVVITGASSGVGRACARLLAREGASLVLSSRSEPVLRAVQQECYRDGAGTVLVKPADVLDDDAVEAVAESAVRRFGRIDAWVHTAAVVAYGRFEDVPADVFRRVVDTGIHGTANVARTALPRFRQQGAGTLVLLESLLGEIVTPFMSSYVTGKWGVRGLGRVLQVEQRGHRGVHVCVVSPGSVNTPVYLQAASYLGKQGRPPPPIVSPDAVARAIVATLDRPRRYRAVGPVNRIARLGFVVTPWLFDALVTPLMRLAGVSRGAVEAHEGNVLRPRPDGEAERGRWPADPSPQPAPPAR
jgi:NAD(P)-dependent dehydrogenase (short-subunit alcohol dehydrogenase family)